MVKTTSQVSQFPEKLHSAFGPLSERKRGAGSSNSGSSLLSIHLRQLRRAAHSSQHLEHSGPHQPALIQLFQILEQEEFVHSVKDSSCFLPFPSLEDSKNLKPSLSIPPEQQGRTAQEAGHRDVLHMKQGM